jgi:hypothetical protein
LSEFQGKWKIEKVAQVAARDTVKHFSDSCAIFLSLGDGQCSGGASVPNPLIRYRLRRRFYLRKNAATVAWHLKFLALCKIASQAAHPLPGRWSPGLASALLKIMNTGDVLTNSPTRHHKSKSLDVAMEGLEIIIL